MVLEPKPNFFVEGGAWFNASCVYIRGSVDFNGTSIGSWAGLNSILNVPNFCSVTLDFDVPADCTKFIISTHSVMNSYYMFMTKGTNPMTPVNIDLEARCDSTTDSSWVFVATKSSGLAMNASDEYKLGYFYK